MDAKIAKGCVLVATDFSPCSERAAVFAASISECMKASLVLLHVVHDPGHAPGYYADTKRKKVVRRLEDAAAAQMTEHLAALREQVKSKVIDKAQSVLVTGLPVKRTLEIVERTKPMMVVMGSQGRTGLERLLIGSKAEQIVRLCPVPVTIVK
jgi:nucleotide-binding universal stress UspA family protein